MGISKEDILGAKDAEVRSISIPEWGGECFIRVLTGPELDALTTAQMRLGGEKSTVPARIAAEVVGRTLCTSDGARIFADEDIGALAGKAAKVLTRVAQEALDFNGLTEESAAAIRGN